MAKRKTVDEVLMGEAGPTVFYGAAGNAALRYLNDLPPEVQQAAWAAIAPETVQSRAGAPEKCDGPFGIDGFAWRGEKHRGLTPRAFKLIQALWEVTDHTLPFVDAVEAVYGDDLGPDDPLNGPRKDANRFFRERQIALCISVSGMSRTKRVTLAEPKLRESAKQAKKAAKRP